VGWWGTEAGSLETRLPRYRDALWLFPTAVRKLRAREAEWGKELGVRPLRPSRFYQMSRHTEH
jgi:hypothetical protein